jgi:hypothetical protein
VGPCDLPTPALVSATPGDRQVTLSWSDESSDPDVEGYRVYRYSYAAVAWLLIADAGLSTSYTDANLTNGTRYGYKVTAYGTNCESVFSNALWAIPNGAPLAGTSSLATGKWVKSGKGKHATRSFASTSSFTRGDEIVLRVRIVDRNTGLPLSGAVADLWISGPETRTFTTEPSDSAGYAEATWKTAASGKGKKGGTGTATGQYLAQVTGVTASGHDWDDLGTMAPFSIE